MSQDIIANKRIVKSKLQMAQTIILNLQQELANYIADGSGPFLAAIHDDKGNLIAKNANSVVSENCSHNHAEMNAIKAAEKALGTYDLSKCNLSLYVTSEPCMMCLGGIMWSGIKAVYYGVPSKDVEKITGFDEGFKPDWFNEFKKRGITVYGNIEAEVGKKVLREYVKNGRTVYQPKRK
ncbi:MAG: nucleoside deaminase [Rhodospirillales bacterium]|nr:nucleoside deaminase [Rhodospirillales bacterium]